MTKRPVKSLRSLSFADRVVIVSFAVGVVLVILGIALIMESQYTARMMVPIDGGDGIFGYPAWDEAQLATGIIFALVGTAASSASSTYVILRRKLKRV